ncbi:hypothetical protein Rleg9DRAFT_7305 [Rhizobium leguminosarum bv. trifolii WSM597]|uniref:Hydrolase (Metallo-beta-lactamase superfamily) n=1 Tax=Rhizobium leguminosarum bv. trifolii WSM597 TaxID=754764 RepID=I9NJX4_RHILT|nr:hypothetical protein Rleg9DRAFT_1065 [Rhizobium leguminosarum bv. trifolii WSM597]EJB08264.1 hypothetical protein Rleg9DRAFT_7305 [Rhizobium leguminosarum bv. trifolii WSM597]
MWVIDGGPGLSEWAGQSVTTWSEFLLPRLEEISEERPVPIDLGMVSHIDDDHINGMEKIMNDLTSVRVDNPARVKFLKFWFNSFERLVDHQRASTGETQGVETAGLPYMLAGQVDDQDGDAVIQSIPQGISLSSDLKTLKLQDNPPFKGTIVATKREKPIKIKGGAEVTILGPLEKRLEALRKKWIAALEKKDEKVKEAEIASLFLPDSKLDTAIPNLSSIVMLVSIRGKTMLLTGDAQGKDVVEAWKAMEMPDGPQHVHLLKVPHHGSNRNNPEIFLRFFPADHYVFSANGKYDNPDPETVEAVVMVNKGRQFKLHFTNENVKWTRSYKGVNTLPELLDVLKEEYGGDWCWAFRKTGERFVAVELE